MALNKKFKTCKKVICGYIPHYGKLIPYFEDNTHLYELPKRLRYKKDKIVFVNISLQLRGVAESLFGGGDIYLKFFRISLGSNKLYKRKLPK